MKMQIRFVNDYRNEGYREIFTTVPKVEPKKGAGKGHNEAFIAADLR